MKYKVLLRVYLKHISFRYLIDAVYFLYENIIKNNLENGDWLKIVERLYNN